MKSKLRCATHLLTLYLCSAPDDGEIQTMISEAYQCLTNVASTDVGRRHLIQQETVLTASRAFYQGLYGIIGFAVLIQIVITPIIYSSIMHAI